MNEQTAVEEIAPEIATNGAAAAAVDVSGAAKIKAAEYREIDILKLFESPTNPRRHYDEKRLEELTASIRRKGVVEPLIARKVGNRFEIIAGSRRYRGATRAGLPKLGVIVKDLSDDDVAEVQCIENLQRDDLHPLEESESYARLLGLPGYSVEVIAERISKDISYVYRRIQLSKLIEPIKTAFLENAIPLSHAQAICRHTDEDQERIFAEGCFAMRQLWNDGKPAGRVKEPVSYHSLQAWISEKLLLVLARAPWDREDPTLFPVAGSCSACKKRTGKQTELFEELAGADDRCLDGRCYTHKMKAHIDNKIAAAKSKNREMVKVASGIDPKTPKDAIAWGKYVEIGKAGVKTCPHAEPAIIVAGVEGIGKTLSICRTSDCAVHGKKQPAGDSKSRIAQQWEEKAERLNGDIVAAARKQALFEIFTKAKGKESLGNTERKIIAGALLAQVIDLDLTVEISEIFGFESEPDEAKRIDRLRGFMERTAAADFMARVLVLAIAPDLQLWIHGGNAENNLDIAARSFKVNMEKIAKEIGDPMREEFSARKKEALAPAKKKESAAPALAVAPEVIAIDTPAKSKRGAKK